MWCICVHLIHAMMIECLVSMYLIYIHYADGRQIMGPYGFSRNATNLAWHEHDIHSSKLPQTKDFLLKPTKDFHKIPNTMLSNDSSGLLASKGIGTKTSFPG